MKRKVYRVLLAVALLLTSGCIENDIPYPLIFGGIQSIEIEGGSDVKIDATNQLITVTISDTVDLRSVEVLSIVFTTDCSSTLSSGDVIDLCSTTSYGVGEPYEFTVSTFQQYDWKIVATQTVTKEIVMSGSIGSATFDNENFEAIVSVAQTQDLSSVVVEKFSLAPSVATYSPDPYSVTDFSKPVEFLVSYFGIEELWTIEAQYSASNVVTGAVNPWATFAYLYGDVLATSTSQAAFEYQKDGASEWTTLYVENLSGKIEAVITDLEPTAKYNYRALLGDEYGDTESFTTDDTPTVPNLNFDEAYYESSVWYFNGSGGNSYWATGNLGVRAAGKESSTTSVSGDEAVSGSAVKMVTYNGVLLVSVAAGNLFTGTYETVMSSSPSEALKSAVMGREFEGRPTSLSGWYKYSPEVIGEGSYWQKAATEFGYNFADSVGMKDWCQIYVVLEKWPDDATVRPDESLIERVAYASLQTNELVAEYEYFTLPLEYYDLYTEPNHISIVATSSLNGGYFCGAASSTLYVDEFSLSYDYLE